MSGDRRQFDQTGWQRGGDRWHRARIEPWTQKHADEIERRKIERSNLIYRLSEIEWSKFATGTLRSIYAALEAANAEPALGHAAEGKAETVERDQPRKESER